MHPVLKGKPIQSCSILLVFWPSNVLKLTCQLINDALGPTRLAAKCADLFDQSTTFYKRIF